jgi:hypothetical protein
MRVALEVEGGFATMRRSYVVDDAVLAPDEASRLAELVGAVGPDAGDGGGSTGARDARRYVLTSEDDDGAKREVVATDPVRNSAVRALRDFVTQNGV